MKGEIIVKLRNLNNLPVFYDKTALIIGQIEKGVIGENYRLAYIVIDIYGQGPKMIKAGDFHLGEDAVVIKDLDSIKSYEHGEELSINKLKIGDVIFDSEGKEIGIISDFVISLETKEIKAIEISAGGIKDLLEGRAEVPLQDVCQKSGLSAVIAKERGDLN